MQDNLSKTSRRNHPEGLLLLPKNIDSYFLENPSFSYLSNVECSLHMPCLDVNYSHMIDLNGISLEEKGSIEALMLILSTSFLIANDEVLLFNLFVLLIHHWIVLIL